MDTVRYIRPNTSTGTRLDYCRYLLVSQINYTLTNLAEHSDRRLSHLPGDAFEVVITEEIVYGD